ncbi:hypothetical protein [Phocaeicola salanitronis]|nr:hypothetical protein [Phocaeicola salanitronis]MDM8306883.1 hypothetical protein [Phocaeicola salanitronis]
MFISIQYKQLNEERSEPHRQSNEEVENRSPMKVSSSAIEDAFIAS